jgi:hypothetical protein
MRYNPAMRKPKPIPMYPCGHCKTLIPRVQALRQAGYCEACEFMTVEEVMRETLVSWPLLGRLEQRHEWNPVRTCGRLLLHRAEVEHFKARRRAQKKGWFHLCETAG